MQENNHGGKRTGAGRKPVYEGSVTRLRVPDPCVPAVRDMIARVFELQHFRKDRLEVMYPAVNPSILARPLFSSPVPAGFPSPADDYIEGHLDLNEFLVEHPSATFYVRVTGESMVNAGILPGDILVVDRALEAAHGSIVIAVVDNELTVKRLHRKGGVIELHPENPLFPVIVFEKTMELTIWGVVAGVTRKL